MSFENTKNIEILNFSVMHAGAETCITKLTPSAQPQTRPRITFPQMDCAITFTDSYSPTDSIYNHKSHRY